MCGRRNENEVEFIGGIKNHKLRVTNFLTFGLLNIGKLFFGHWTLGHLIFLLSRFPLLQIGLQIDPFYLRCFIPNIAFQFICEFA